MESAEKKEKEKKAQEEKEKAELARKAAEQQRQEEAKKSLAHATPAGTSKYEQEKDKVAASAGQKVGAWKELDRKKKEEQERKEREMEARLKAQGSAFSSHPLCSSA